jgi:hypothetical protein
VVENNLIDKEVKVLKLVQARTTNENMGLEDYKKYLNNKYKICEIKRIIRDFSARS